MTNNPHMLVKSRKRRLTEHLLKKFGDITVTTIFTLIIGTGLAMAGVGVATQDPQAALEVPADVWEWGTNMNRAAIKYNSQP